MQLSKHGVSRPIEKKIYKSLYRVLADIKQPRSVEIFFTGILTETERVALAKRLAIAVYLKKNKSYQVIKNELKVSSATIATVQNLMIENNEGLNNALKAIEADEWASKLTRKISTVVKGWFN
ncbi:hypothetical protein COW80_00530 [Candidatus Beckwithbacteria bacterium CG22_combo_CG10-13_8_21_14_all_01_47_9]|uniref:TrpR-like protein YerC/YecD n=5 Tax=Microgenomates group TaxID=1794810 RepID=A0A2H0E1U2_9BACT|nr:MAG: hypothetical protein COX09_05145 [Candidatus Beckwithbacteria bacterium CG23_combo_of_CG06-09_8_20_14_all_47_9]PIP88406.1 MAG: hypothetical protein COW80_00530 [Candidatus Beckwithbacteria bacterium CG22_combo_CG10-13_8_21_14_all_01_47_9]PIU74552.1 MAG: hypothetical protein COS77_00925 [Candidatus Roizmanbacteria bacterium CG06_land_8_20_14_3_00_34_14]PJA23387.1 MAG: hypothetical protein COX59_00180 [Candidatus Beckwithbacteria bacterium CG_4_10_14_0_2_um_filter_47_25]PJC66656.1 MAG: hy